MRFTFTLLAALLAISILSNDVIAQEKNEGASRERLQSMLNHVEAIEIQPTDEPSTLATKFHKTPILRFGDASRETADGAIWKAGDGRPEVIIATEHVRHEGTPFLSIEFLCLTDQKFTLHTDTGWKWRPANAAISFMPLDKIPPPRESPTARALQTRQLARRFTASQKYEGEFYRLRLLPQPIDQYKIKHSSGEQDGAIFVFANGTNPEVLLLLETTNDGWQYGLARMCGAAPTVKFDGSKVWTLPPMSEVGKSWTLDYTGDVIELE